MMDESFLLPDRFEGLRETAGEKDITKIIIPVEYGLKKFRIFTKKFLAMEEVLF